MITIIKIKILDFHVTAELENGETLDIPHRAANLYKLVSGRSIDSTEYAQLKAESQRFRCKKKALDYLAIRARSVFEMERYLTRKGFSHDIIREIMNDVVESGYVDDYDYAKQFIRSKLNRKLVGKHLLASELQKKGVSRDIIKQALKDTASNNNNIDEIYEIAVKKYQVLKLKKNGLAKLAYFLQHRGFESEIVHTVIARIIQNER
jgi:regulatory protein